MTRGAFFFFPAISSDCILVWQKTRKQTINVRVAHNPHAHFCACTRSLLHAHFTFTIGFDWRSETKARSWISFIDHVEAFRQYKEKHGHLSVTFKANESLYYWCANIRSVRRGKVGKCKIKLTQERIAALDAIGFDWRWSKSVSQPFDSLGGDADKASGKSEESCFCYDRKR